MVSSLASDSLSGFGGAGRVRVRFHSVYPGILSSHPFHPSQPIRIQWHVIIAVQRGVCVMLGLAKDASSAQAAGWLATFSLQLDVSLARKSPSNYEAIRGETNSSSF